ncbi:unnamed protein product [Cuscuta epithymum]|uniref:PHD-type domain-containing protein n=1 Tax=Cuscuta epithymum TaxID=186058 RepID=A0AAV0C4G0_9ASTE|nr:unnamed protein product [Cuscuta epithymum]
MEEHVSSDCVAKDKKSPGCLIIRKKDGEVGGTRRGTIGSSESLQKNQKKRPRVITHGSGSGDELLEPCKRKADELNSPITYRRRAEGNDNKTRSNGKRSRLDLFDFDEYDEFDQTALKNRNGDGMEGGTGSSREFKKGSSGVKVAEKMKLNLDDSANALGNKNKDFNRTSKRRVVAEEDDADFPISMLKSKHKKSPKESIRLQGKNGVLKVMVNTKAELSHKKHDCHDSGSREHSTSKNLIKKKLEVQPTICLGSEKRHLSLQREKSKMKSCKVLVNENTPASDSETDGDGQSSKVAPTTTPACNSLNIVKKEENKISTDKIIPPTNKQGKTRGGASTEKQQLREKIRGILMDAGWTIDYRPRRNRDYIDSVYISPSGTGYWSIVKAYDAFLKKLEEDGGAKKSAAPFSPISEDINKLTRQTRKRIERDLKKKKKDHSSSKDKKKTSGKESAEGTDSDQHDERLSSYIKKSGKSLKGKLHSRHQRNEFDTHKIVSISEAGRLKDMIGKSSVSPAGSSVQGRKSKITGRCTLLVRGSDNGKNSESDGYIPYSGKRTLLAWMIDSGTVKLSEKVQYMNRRKTRTKLEGWITRDGIHCGCCSKILTVSKFELHAGSKLRQPFQNIVLECGASLLQCLTDAWNRQVESERQGFCSVDIDGDDPNDDTCGICGDGGDLICCDGCPSTFHQSCMGIMMLPHGDWHCPYCVCKFCGIADESPVEDNVGTTDLHLCILCEKKYHKLCRQDLKTNKVLPVKTKTSFTSFCGQTCQEIYDQLWKIVGVKHELEAGFSWSLIQRTNLDSDTSHFDFSQRVECNSKLAVALSIMDECFLPIVDRRSGINIIHNVLYNCGSNFSRLSYSGFYTAILERGDEIVCAASLRIHGIQLAEMPFIGTRHIYRRQGMCRRLLSAIEMVLHNLKVKKLIIPAISEHIHTWTVVFGFNQLEESHKQEMKSINVLAFPGVDMLQKQIVKQGASEGLRTADFEKPTALPAPMGTSEMVCSAKYDANECDDTGLQSIGEMHAKVETGPQDCSLAINFLNKEITAFKSEVSNEFAGSSANLRHSTEGENDSILDTQNAVMDSPGKSIPSSAHSLHESCEVFVEASAQVLQKSTDKSVSDPDACGISVQTISQLCSESSQSKDEEDRGEACSVPEASKGDAISSLETSDIAMPTYVSGKEVFTDPGHCSSDRSIQCSTEDAVSKETLQPTEISEPTVQLTSHLNTPVTNNGANEHHLCSEKTTDTKGAHGVSSFPGEGDQDLALSNGECYESENVKDSC